MCVREWRRTSAAGRLVPQKLELHVAAAAELMVVVVVVQMAKGGFARHHRRLRHYDHDDDDLHHHDCRRRHRCTSIAIAVVVVIVVIFHEESRLRALCMLHRMSHRRGARNAEARWGTSSLKTGIGGEPLLSWSVTIKGF